MNGMTGFVRDIRSLCPECLTEVDGRLFIRDTQMWVGKVCPKHGEFTALLEPDASLYLRCMAPPGRPRYPYATAIPVSYRCNLKCTWCYLPDRGQTHEPTPEEVLDIVARCGTPYIVFSGGEPTMRDDLPELIRSVRQKFPDRIVSLLTNGVKLDDPAYLARLEEAGLGCIVFSLNGFRPATDEFFSGRDLTEIKRSALDNLRRRGMATILSMTVARGVNEDEIPALYEYAIRNIDFVRTMRLRNVTDLGVYAERPRLYLSDLLRVVSGATGFSMDEMCLVNDVAHRRTKTGNRFSFSIFPAMMQRRRQAALGSPRAKAGETLAGIQPEIQDGYRADVRRLIGEKSARLMETEPADTLLPIRNFVIEVFCWPTPANADLSECRRSAVNHVTLDGQILPFWEALFRNDRLRGPQGPRPTAEHRSNR